MQLYLLRCNTLQKILELSSFHVIFIEDRASRFALPVFRGCIDIGDGCCRRMVLVTTIRCCWQFWPFWSPTSTIFLHKRRAPTSQICQIHSSSWCELNFRMKFNLFSLFWIHSIAFKLEQVNMSCRHSVRHMTADSATIWFPVTRAILDSASEQKSDL